MIKLLKYGNTNCYYIEEKNGSVLLDTDWAGTLQLFYSKIKELNIKSIDYLLITHYHPDHMGIYTPGHSDDSISLILDEGIALVGDLYDFNSASAFNDEKINNSWKNILSHNISKICYGHHEQILNK